MSFPNYADEIKQRTEPAPEPRVVIDSIEFDGEYVLPLAVREQLVTSLKQRELNSSSDWLREVEEAIRGSWQEHGFFQVEVKLAPRPVGGDATTRRVALTVHVEEGQQYRLREIQIRPADIGSKKGTAFPPEELRKLIPLVDGEIFNVAKIREGLDALQKAYGSKGYIDFTASPFTDLDSQSRLILLTLELDEQRQFRIGRVETRGLDPKLEAIFKSRVKPGDIVNRDVIEEFFREFKPILPADASPVNVAMHRDMHTGIVDIVFDLPYCPQTPKF